MEWLMSVDGKIFNTRSTGKEKDKERKWEPPWNVCMLPSSRRVFDEQRIAWEKLLCLRPDYLPDNHNDPVPALAEWLLSYGNQIFHKSLLSNNYLLSLSLSLPLSPFLSLSLPLSPLLSPSLSPSLPLSLPLSPSLSLSLPLSPSLSLSLPLFPSLSLSLPSLPLSLCGRPQSLHVVCSPRAKQVSIFGRTLLSP